MPDEANAPAAAPGEQTLAPAVASTGTTTAAEIEAWFVEQIHNSPVSRDTEIYNHIRTAVDALKQRLAAL